MGSLSQRTENGPFVNMRRLHQASTLVGAVGRPYSADSFSFESSCRLFILPYHNRVPTYDSSPPYLVEPTTRAPLLFMSARRVPHRSP